jgi:fibrillarin-like pre-rRNA processing protein
MVPIMADASRPESYAPLAQSVDVVYQDIAQKDQPGILARNIEAIPPSSGTAILMVKARSIDVTANPAKVFARVERELEGLGYTVAERVPLEPYERDHEAMVVKAGGALDNIKK